jgi:hypothetical protein
MTAREMAKVRHGWRPTADRPLDAALGSLGNASIGEGSMGEGALGNASIGEGSGGEE